MTRESIRFDALDGRSLAADLFVPDAAPTSRVIVAPAMGVPRRVYGKLASFVADAGALVMVIDYRGIGDSRSGSVRTIDAKLSDWAELDLAGAVRELERRAPSVPLRWIGHSVGGQLMGLVKDAPIDRAVFFASQSGHWRHWGVRGRPVMWTLWNLAIPITTRVLGYYPGAMLGGGEDLPAGVVRQWASWGRHRGYVQSYAEKRDGDPVFATTSAIRAYAFTDDDYAPERAVRALLDAYGRAETELRVVAPAQIGKKKIGHFGVLRDDVRASIWTEARAWLLDPASLRPLTSSSA